ncbi:aminotransferase class IV [Lentzea sp. NPDC051213]|uniref:aminotransferase class IV n=1 Tax=Lentzea sp. NPDC051213 TaxID=3364126 RepID=UPI0037ABCE8B
MSSPAMPRLEINGRAAGVDTLWFPALSNYGHYTAMQIRNGRTRGLELHLDRLRAATRELFDADLDDDRVRAYIRHALGDDTGEASVFVTVFRQGAHADPSIMVTVGRPSEVSAAPQRLQSVGYQRPLAHIKHVGTFAQTHYGAVARRNGFDEALLTGPDGAVSEAAAANIGFFDGVSVVWPSAPALHGITMQILESTLADVGVLSQRRPVRLDDLASFSAAFVSSSIGITPVGQIDGHTFSVDADLMTVLVRAYESVAWDAV